MDLRRVRHGEWIAGISGLALLVVMFLGWYSFPGGGTADAWETFTVVDVVLAFAGAMGVGLFAAAATQRSPAVPQALGALTVPVSFVAAVLVVIRTLSLPGEAKGRELGLYLGIAGAFGVLVGAWRSIGDESFPREARTEVEVTPLPAPKRRAEPTADE
jgi:hypothetical protein